MSKREIHVHFVGGGTEIRQTGYRKDRDILWELETFCEFVRERGGWIGGDQPMRPGYHAFIRQPISHVEAVRRERTHSEFLQTVVIEAVPCPH